MTNNNRLYMTLNRASEWERCLLYNMKIDDNSVIPDEKSGTDISAAVMITASSDSSEHNFCWRSILLDVIRDDNMIMKISAYASDSTLVTLGDRTLELDSFLSDNTVPAQERIKLIEELFTPVFSNCVDGPLNLNGRYIWIMIEFFMLESYNVRVNTIKLLLNSERMVDYLPEVYRTEDGENGFLTRFMSIFDSLFFEMDNSIEKLSRSLDYSIARGELLKYLAEWVCIDSAYVSEAELRRKIKESVNDYRSIGVKRGLERWIENEYGIKPNIVEYFSVRKMVYEGKEREVYHRLFGDNPYRFFVMLPETTFENTHELNIFVEKLKKRIPANTEAEIVIMRNNVVLENHTYLGINSVISGYSQANVDTGNKIAHDIILGGSINE